HTRFSRDWSSDVCSSDLAVLDRLAREAARPVETRRPQPEVEAHRVRGLLRGGGFGCRGSPGLGVAGQVFLDARLAALEATQVVQLAGADLAAALHLDRVDRGAVALEHALDAVAVRDLAHGERDVQAGVLPGDDHALVGLDALAVAFLTLTLTTTVSPGPKTGSSRVACSDSKFCSREWIEGLFIGVGLVGVPGRLGAPGCCSASARGPASWLGGAKPGIIAGFRPGIHPAGPGRRRTGRPGPAGPGAGSRAPPALGDGGSGRWRHGCWKAAPPGRCRGRARPGGWNAGSRAGAAPTGPRRNCPGRPIRHRSEPRAAGAPPRPPAPPPA